MKFNLKKLGQTATEYLIILAVVIVIALIIVSVMGGIPGIGKAGQDKAEQAFWASTELAIPTFANTQTNGMVLKMKNNLHEGVYINSILLASDSTNRRVVSNFSSALYLDAGETKTIPLQNTVFFTCIKGMTYSYDVEINYTATASYTFNGYGHKLTGMCGN